MTHSTEATSTPHTAGWSFPAEWAAHRTCYTAWPAHAYAWGTQLSAAQTEFVAFATAFAHAGQETLTILVDAEHDADARAKLGAISSGLEFLRMPYGDVWLRDTGPLFLIGASGLGSVRFRFNGWGEKFIYPHDAELSARLASWRGGPAFETDYVLEGGALEVDGQGTLLTTRSCLQNPNRGTPQSDAVIAARLRAALGIQQIVWLDAGLANDHTDGHIDNIARFVAPGRVVCMHASGDDDPNRETLDAIASSLRAARSASGTSLEVVRIPSPGRVLGSDGHVMPASYMNFYIGNARVLMPAFKTRYDQAAREALQALFPGREVVACSARALLEGGGTFHCMTQQEPLP